MNRWLWLFGLVIVAQLGVPASMIVRREVVLRTGSVHRFRTEPVDPYDAFRGRYVALAYRDRSVDLPLGAQVWRRGMPVYVLLSTDEEGYTVPVGIQTERPERAPYIMARVGYVHHANRAVMLDYPLDRYYMNEKEAPEAELALIRRPGRSGPQIETYVEVRIHRGFPVIAGLFLDALPVRAFLARERDP
jgi:uncharacterized membrane-anchored protein